MNGNGTTQRTAMNGRSFRHRVRSYVDRVAASTGLLRWCERRMRQGLTILMYHRVLPTDSCAAYPLQSLVISEGVFRRQMQWLAESCRVLPVREALRALKDAESFERPLVSVTFDDGYADNAELAAPILEANGLRGTFFVTSGFVESGEPMWFDRAADAWGRLGNEGRQALAGQLRGMTPALESPDGEPDIRWWMEGLKRTEPARRMDLVRQAETSAEGEIDAELYCPMTREQLAALHERGHEIASHTVTHPILPQLDDNDLREELERSAAQLSEWTGSEVAGVCYPNGDFDPRVAEAAAAANYAYACTTRAGLNKPGVNAMRLARLPITMQHTAHHGGEADDIGFRSEVCRLRQCWR